MRSSPPPARRAGQTVRWLAVAAGAVLLASCRSISLTAPVSALAPLPAVAVTSADAADTVDPVPLLPVESPTAAAEPSERSFALPTIRDGDVQRTGLDLPSPPLPSSSLLEPPPHVVMVELGMPTTPLLRAGWRRPPFLCSLAPSEQYPPRLHNNSTSSSSSSASR